VKRGDADAQCLLACCFEVGKRVPQASASRRSALALIDQHWQQ
jgi:hypothetical protein